MTKNVLEDLTDEQLLQEAQKMKKRSVTDAILIGCMAGIIFYSLINNTLGFVMLIPVILIYKLVNKSKEDRALKEILTKRGLKEK